ncbi:hypothetical protein VNI00_007614 [Paramarasmius palmivorus]|uniref:HNH nuclease domain-containing protein n=1 Tax=Paramarasmius palmivorus TaxID=297713 RepID=A0AAW0D468_9AGAR
MTFADLQAGALPRPEETLTTCAENVRNAYAKIFQVQERTSREPELRHTRVVGYMLINLDRFRHILEDSPVEYAADQINRHIYTPSGPTIDSVVFELGRRYEGLLMAFRNRKQMIDPSMHPSRPSFDDEVDMHLGIVDGSRRDNRTVKKEALVRDGFRCVATSVLDHSYVKAYKQLRNEPPLGAIDTECCHIIAVANFTECAHAHSQDDRKLQATNLTAILSSFGIKIYEKLLNEDGFGDICNILTLRSDVHKFFDRLETWFEPTQNAHEYKIYHAYEWTQPALHTHDTVTFKIHDSFFEKSASFTATMKSKPDDYLPNPKSLALHAACARVAHMSGAAQVMDKWNLDLEDKSVLASDGSDMDLFIYAMSKLVSR